MIAAREQGTPTGSRSDSGGTGFTRKSRIARQVERPWFVEVIVPLNSSPKVLRLSSFLGPQIHSANSVRGGKRPETGTLCLREQIAQGREIRANQSTYCARHGFATEMYRPTKNLFAVMNVMGHTTVSTTMKYQHQNIDEVAAVASHRVQ